MRASVSSGVPTVMRSLSLEPRRVEVAHEHAARLERGVHLRAHSPPGTVARTKFAWLGSTLQPSPSSASVNRSRFAPDLRPGPARVLLVGDGRRRRRDGDRVAVVAVLDLRHLADDLGARHREAEAQRPPASTPCSASATRRRSGAQREREAVRIGEVDVRLVDENHPVERAGERLDRLDRNARPARRVRVREVDGARARRGQRVDGQRPPGAPGNGDDARVLQPRQDRIERIRRLRDRRARRPGRGTCASRS